MSTIHEPGSAPSFDKRRDAEPEPTSGDRERARRRLEKKKKFRDDLVAYVVINAFLVAIWAVSGHGYFWPGWVMGGWAVFLLLDAWNLYFRGTVTEADVDRELRRRG